MFATSWEPIVELDGLSAAEGETMPRAEDYRRYAAECLAIAQRTGDLGDRVRLLELANAFNELVAKLGPAETRGGDDSQAESPV